LAVACALSAAAPEAPAKPGPAAVPGKAAAKPSTPTAKPAPAPKATAVPKPEETVLFVTQAGKRQVLGRSDGEGLCKAYLGPKGRGWVGFADPSVRGDDYQAISSPDGQQFALLSARNGSINLWLVSADGLQWTQLTDDDGGILTPAEAAGRVLAFSPDGKRLAVIRRHALWVLDLHGGEPLTLTSGRVVTSLAWSPDSAWIAYISGKNIFKTNAAGGLDVQLASEAADQEDLVWQPDAKQELLYFLGGGLRSVDSRRRVELVAPSACDPNDIALLGPGKQIATLAPAANGLYEVSLVTVGEKATKMEQVTQGGAEAVLPSASAKSLYFVRDSVLWRCNLDGSKSHPLGLSKISDPRVGQLPPLKGICP
jgi:WD40 repeat protein